MKKSNLITKTEQLSMFFMFLIAVMILVSPYGEQEGYQQKAILVQKDINAPSSKLFKYLGNSSNAAKWSTFVREIKSINCVQDGEVGSKRRCYGIEEEIVWDEEILELSKNKKRLLNVYNAKGFAMMASDLRTEQVYEELSNGRTRLKLTLFFKEGRRNLFSELKMYFAAYFIADIFEDNLSNIKRINEQV